MSSSLLSRVQLEVLALRSRGLSLGEVARRLGLSRQAVWALERRALRAVEAARRTLAAFEVATAPAIVVVKPGGSLDAAASRVLEEADAAGVKLRLDYMGVYALLRGDSRVCAERGDKLVAVIRRDGGLSVYCLSDVAEAMDLAERVVEL